MNKKLSDAFTAFQRHFLYSPEFPPNVDFDDDAYADELLKCVQDDFDYTIEKYGTVARPWNPDKNGYHPSYID